MPTTRHEQYVYPVINFIESNNIQRIEIIYPPIPQYLQDILTDFLSAEEITPTHPLADIVDRLKGNFSS